MCYSIGAEVHDVEQIVEDHLTSLIIQNFDAKKADSIFTEEGGVSKGVSTEYEGVSKGQLQ